MKLSELGKAFRAATVDEALCRLRAKDPSALPVLEAFQREIPKEVGFDLYELSKQCMAELQFQVALRALTLARKVDPGNQILKVRTDALADAMVLSPVRLRMEQLAAQAALGFACAKGHCSCSDFMEKANCRGLLSGYRYDMIRGLQIASLGTYLSRRNGNRWSDTLKRIKHGGERTLLIPIAQLVAGFILGTKLLSKVDAVVPVPPSTEKFASRGFAVNDAIAGELENILGLPRLIALARHSGKTRESTYEELTSQFYVAPHRLGITGLKLLVLEDIWTWGRTIPICAEHLKKAGAADVYAVALAKTEG